MFSYLLCFLICHRVFLFVVFSYLSPCFLICCVFLFVIVFSDLLCFLICHCVFLFCCVFLICHNFSYFPLFSYSSLFFLFVVFASLPVSIFNHLLLCVIIFCHHCNLHLRASVADTHSDLPFHFRNADEIVSGHVNSPEVICHGCHSMQITMGRLCFPSGSDKHSQLISHHLQWRWLLLDMISKWKSVLVTMILWEHVNMSRDPLEL